MPFLTGLRVGVPQRNKLRKSDLTKGLVFCAVPLNNTAIDLVTGVIGTPTGVSTLKVMSPNDGYSQRSVGLASVADGGATTRIEWPASSTLRGATMGPNGTILVLGGTTEQVDGKVYQFGGNCETYNGYGYSVGIDSYMYIGRGYVTRGGYSGNPIAVSSPNGLGSSFGNKTHFFGYGFNSHGVNGNWFYSRTAMPWAGQPAMGTTTTGRVATILAPSPWGTNARYGYNLLTLFWDRELSVAEYQRLYDNIDLLFEPEPLRWVVSGSAPQLLAPISDLSAGGWTPSTGTDLFATLDETTYNDSDYIVSTTATSCEMRVATGTDPAVSTGHILRYRLLAGTGSIEAILKQGSTTIASFGPHTLTGSAQDFSQTLTAGQADSIIDYSDLRVVFTAS